MRVECGYLAGEFLVGDKDGTYSAAVGGKACKSIPDLRSSMISPGRMQVTCSYSVLNLFLRDCFVTIFPEI